MLQLTDTTTIQCPAPQLFTMAADPQQQVRWDRAGLRQVDPTDAPLTTGTRYRGKFRRVGTVDYEVTAFEPNQRFARDADLRIGHLHHEFEFEELSEGTRLNQRIQFEPHGVARLAGPLLKPLLHHRMRVIDDELTTYAEGGDR